VSGAVLGGIAGRAVGAPFLGAAIGGINGALTGWRQIYEWRSWRGRVAFLLDSTWALATTGSGLVLLAISEIRSLVTGRVIGFEPELSVRRNRMVHRGGVVLRRGFAVTIGNIVNGATDRQGRLTESRRRLVEDHEDVHVWQARIFGPLYPVLYLGWFVAGIIVALVRRSRRPAASLLDDIDHLSYYRNPFEWHAYSRAGQWPPHWVDADRVWKRPFRATSGSRAMPS
jgi:hypothetical protein